MGTVVSRRTVLGGTAAAALAPALGGCGEEAEPRMPPPKADVAVLTAAIAAEERLVALYETARGAHAGLAGSLDPILARHREHLAVLRRFYIPGTGDRSATPSPTARPAPSVPSDEKEAVELLREAETEAAAARASDVQRVAPGVAQLMASIGACEAAHAAVLTGAT